MIKQPDALWLCLVLALCAIAAMACGAYKTAALGAFVSGMFFAASFTNKP